MTAPHQTRSWRERGDSQWADYGVNVGHAVYGGIHFHPPASPAARSRLRNGTAQSALTDLARACERVAAALAHLRPDEAGKEKR